MKRVISVLFLLISFVSLAMAHGNEQHVMGIVTKITGNQITVKNMKGQIVTVATTDKTEFRNGTNKANLVDLKIGDRIVIHADKVGNALEAHMVQFSDAPASGASPASKR